MFFRQSIGQRHVGGGGGSDYYYACVRWTGKEGDRCEGMNRGNEVHVAGLDDPELV
jgi:hypothetical protein